MSLEPAYFSAGQLAQRFGVGETTIRRLIRERKITVVSVGKQIRIPLSAVEAFAARFSRIANGQGIGSPCPSTPGGRCICPCHAVRHGRQTSRKRPENAWTPDHDAFITEQARQGRSLEEIARATAVQFPGTPRSAWSVGQRLARLGVSLRDGWWSRTELTQLLGLGQRALVYAEQRGLLRSEPYGQWRRIAEAEAERFVREHAGTLVDPRRVRDPKLKAVAETSAIVNRRRESA